MFENREQMIECRGELEAITAIDSAVERNNTWHEKKYRIDCTQEQLVTSAQVLTKVHPMHTILCFSLV